MNRPVLLIDALNLFSRHYVRNPAMSTHGHQAGGIVGFMNSLKTIVEMTNPSLIIVAWEAGGSKRKRDIFPEYKSNRRPPRFNRYYEDDIPDTNENRMHQIKVLVNVLKNVPVCQMFVEDCEADDIIGYLCRNKFVTEKKIIASSDKDFYQLLNETTTAYSWSSKKFIGPDDVKTEFSMMAENFCIAKAICGDPSDNVPGAKGVGFKTLAKRIDLLSKEISLNEVFQICEDLNNKSNIKIYKLINENRDLIKRNWRLMYLDVSNLAAVQVRKIDATVDSFKPTKNKMQLMRSLIEEGLGAFDSHEFFSAFAAL